MIVSDLQLIFPELILAGAALLLLLIGAIFGNGARKFVDMIAFLTLIIVALVIHQQSQGIQSGFTQAFIRDGFADVFKIMIVITSAIMVLFAGRFFAVERIAKFEMTILILLATLGMMLMISAHGLIALYLGVELQSLALYVVASFNRDKAQSSEAGLKYFVLGALSSGMLLYGMSFIYGATGAISFNKIAEFIAHSEYHGGVIFGLVFMIAGLVFKLSLVPFHMWTPDVYEGAPTPATAFFATAPKIAAAGLLARVLFVPFHPILQDWQPILIFVAIASMVLGAFGGIGQKSIKRLLAYSSIGNMGYVAIGLATGSVSGLQGLMIFLIAYVFMTIGIFAVMILAKVQGEQVEQIADLAGLAQKNPVWAFCLAAMLFSLIGIPPLGGFFGKFYIFSAAIEAHLNLLAILGILTSVVSAFYYLRMIKLMYFDPPYAGDKGVVVPCFTFDLNLILWLSTAVIILFFALVHFTTHFVHFAIGSFF